ncbi:hypothetical protein EMPS_05884 [Entomortierella parvispora]|uniref:F-box domain-containing protein n=1 Tax=Entomortierella parvispora TaxID=205924 RepID=A0A9P3LWQ8_9FUNG|nr:hypothetical protein EMPS_05884 [Entomortierella parvispora]
MPPKRRQPGVEPMRPRPAPAHQNQQQVGTSAVQVHPLANPAILARIGVFLDKGSLLQCIRVSRCWHQSFIPKIWRTTSLFIAFELVAIPHRTFIRHAAHIKTLILPVEDAVMFPTGQDIICPNLEELEVERSSSCIPEGENLWDKREFNRAEKSMVRLIRNHSNCLKSLTFNGYLAPPLLDAIIACKKLERLDIAAMFADRQSILNMVGGKADPGLEKWATEFGEFLSRLRSLALYRTWYEDLRKWREPPIYRKLVELLSNIGPTKIQELDLDTGEVMEEAYANLPLFLVRKSPELTRLKWTIKDESGHKNVPMAILAKASASELPPERLQRLERLELPKAKFDDADFRKVIQSIRSLAGLDLSATNFNGSHWKLFQDDVAHHLESLTQVDVQQCTELTGETVQNILCSLPNLQIFKADYIKDVNFLEDDRPWVCRRMKELTLAFVGTRWGTEPAFLSRLSTLTQLEELSLAMAFTQRERLPFDEDFVYEPFTETYNSNDVDYTECRQHVLMLTQEHGLDQLRALRRLRILEGTFNRRALWSEEEAWFALREWLFLESLEGFVLDSQAAKYLKPRVNISKCEVMSMTMEGDPLFLSW